MSERDGGAENEEQPSVEGVQPLAPEERKQFVREALLSLSTKDREELAKELQVLSPEDKRYLVGRLLPDQGVTNTVWLIIVWAFAIVLVVTSVALIAAVFLGPSNIQLLLTVVTTIAGTLAGFISGRTSSNSSSA